MPKANRQPSMENPLREQLALAMAYALRNSLEEFHGSAKAKAFGMTDEVMAFVNRRAARRCFEMLEGKSIIDVLNVTDWGQWPSSMWDAAVKSTYLCLVVKIPEDRLKLAFAEACRNLHKVRSVLQVSVENEMSFRDTAASLPLPLLPSGWDSPSIPVPACRIVSREKPCST